MTGKELRKKRKDLKLTQEKLAKKLGVTANTVARWEREEVPFPDYLELAMNAIECGKEISQK